VKGRLKAIALVFVLLAAFIASRPSKRAGAERRARAAAMSASLRDGVLTRRMLAGLPPKPGAVRGVVMDWNLGDGVATLVAIDDGTVSLFMGAGGDVIGAGGKPSVAAAATRFLSEADRVRDGFASSTSGAGPGRDSVRFYVLTDTATLAAPSIDAATSGRAAALGPLNEAAQALIAEIRKAS
jgi:hypothetical protein